MILFGFWRSLATLRVRIALNLKKVPFEEVSIDLMAGQQRSADYAATNPQMVVPALVEDGTAPLVQSLAILEYLDERFPNPALLPADARGRARVRGLAQIIACDTHPFIVPRVREFLANELGLDEAHAAQVDPALDRCRPGGRRGTSCPGSRQRALLPWGRGQHRRSRLASQAIGYKFFDGTMDAFPKAARIVERCMAEDAFARAHPLRQPGAPAAH